MKSGRRVAALIVVSAALPAAVPALAQAGSLLSGYGGPGQGSQAILGSQLLNGPGSGGGGSGGSPGGNSSSGGSAASAGSSSAALSGRSSGASAGSAAGGHAPAAGASAAAAAGRASGAAGLGGAPSAYGAYPASTRGGTQASETLGLSSGDLPYVLLALGALAFTGLLTGLLTRRRKDTDGQQADVSV